MPRPPGRPDACIFPESLKAGNRAISRYISLVQVAENLLQVDRPNGEKAWVRQQPDLGKRCYATREQHVENCYRLFPMGHDLDGQSRYEWFPSGQDDGVEFGYLVPEAKADLEKSNA